MKQNKILHITPTYHPSIGGIETVVRSLVRHTSSESMQSDVVDLSPKYDVLKEDDVDGVTVWRMPLKPHRLMGHAKHLSQVSQNYDILHVHDPQLMAVSLNALGLKYPHKKVLSTHGGFFHTSNHGGWKKLHWKYLAPHILKRYDTILASSNADAKKFSERTDNVLLVPNGVDVARFMSVSPACEPNLTRWIYWGRLSKNKRLDLVIDLVDRLREKDIQIKLTIAGSDFDSILNDLKTQVENKKLSKNVSFEGEVSDGKLMTLIARNSVFVTGSEHEGFGLSIIEAMGAGLAVICRDIPPLNSFVQNGKTGLLLKFDQAEKDLANIKKFLDMTPIEDMRKNVRTAAKAHDWSIVSKKYIALYDKVLSQ